VRWAQKLKADCLRSLGRTAEADRAEKETLTAWPEMASARRLFRFLGMVANEGKRLVVGMTGKNENTETPVK
jgi:hypothetical protein